MSDGLPIIVIAIALVFVALVLMVWRNWGILRPFIARNKKTFLPLFIIGLVLALSAAFNVTSGATIIMVACAGYLLSMPVKALTARARGRAQG